MKKGANASESSKLSVLNVKSLSEPIRLDTVTVPERPARRIDFAETLAGPANADRKLSLFLLDLYAAAVREDVGGFERCFFSLLQDLVPCDSGWTGVAAPEENRPVNHCSFVYRLPENFFRQWLHVTDKDPLADLSRLVFGQAMVIDSNDKTIDTEFRHWAQRFRLRHLLRVCALDSRFGLIGFLSIYRQNGGHPFSDHEITTVETLIPHLAATMRINRTMQLFRLGQDAVNATRRAICDAYGMIHRADEGFIEALQAEWPSWTGGVLPSPLSRQIRSQPDLPFLGQLHRIDISGIAGLFILELRRRSLADRLASRELETIQHFANGVSYKEVARRMNISPATVRHHLRSAYKKLGVHDKTQMSHLISGMGDLYQSRKP
ncbi:MAG: LuxR family transcriptional regulator [Rhizobium sp.]|nr:MAG: LuxR family transcriptional regulator [Rhizobium sp.]